MQAERVLLETDNHGNLIGLPKLPPNAQLEAIFLLLGKATAPQPKRTPSASLKDAVTISGDLLDPTLSDEEWNASLDRTARQIAGDPEAFE